MQRRCRLCQRPRVPRLTRGDGGRSINSAFTHRLAYKGNCRLSYRLSHPVLVLWKDVTRRRGSSPERAGPLGYSEIAGGPQPPGVSMASRYARVKTQFLVRDLHRPWQRRKRIRGPVRFPMVYKAPEGSKMITRAGPSSHSTQDGPLKPESKPDPKTPVSSGEHDPNPSGALLDYERAAHYLCTTSRHLRGLRAKCHVAAVKVVTVAQLWRVRYHQCRSLHGEGRVRAHSAYPATLSLEMLHPGVERPWRDPTPSMLRKLTQREVQS